MHPTLATAFATEMRAARDRYAARDWDRAFIHLERAHILGQRSTFAHVLSHGWMLRVGWARRDAREIFGQLLRIPAALLFSWLWVPAGNTGGARVSALKPMPIPADLVDLLALPRPRIG